jgi:predicted Fe-Mo cluster-binding NifX family protein
MDLCIPVEQDLGLNSPICAHFGSAPLMAFVNPDTGSFRAKARQASEHGGCAPLALLSGEQLRGVVVSGIGRGALLKLFQLGVPVYQTTDETVADAIGALRSGKLQRLDHDAACCGGHQHGEGHGCGCGDHD